jgi:hypothetical protein
VGGGVLAICLSIAAAAGPGLPGLFEAQEAAARLAAGLASEDASREARARAAHWTPQLRAQGSVRASDENRAGQRYGSPLIEDDVGSVQTWSVLLTWDLSQVVFAREETQLALAHARLAQLRQEARAKVSEVWVERLRELARFAQAPPAQRLSACLSALQLTARLDALTGGLFRMAVEREELVCEREGDRR